MPRSSPLPAPPALPPEGGKTLRQRLIARIRQAGPLRIDEYMATCLHDPAGGYYATRPALGEGGDFITAPLVSQMFGELIGAWAAETWTRLGAPGRFRLVELGPGDGTLTSDLLRAARAAPGFLDAAELVLVETSAPLRARQAERLGAYRPRWVEAVAAIGDAVPALVVGNEFLDCLPIRQAVRTADGWRERRVDADAGGALSFVASEAVAGPPGEAPLGAVWEHAPAVAAAGAEIGGLVARAGGAALLIDYGRPGRGDSLQAVRGHRKESPLAHPGAADLTAQVDFDAFLAAAASAGATAWPLLTQAELLARLGLATRAEALAAANPSAAARIGRQVRRLTAPEEMGELFKAACVARPGLAPPAFGPA